MNNFLVGVGLPISTRCPRTDLDGTCCIQSDTLKDHRPEIGRFDGTVSLQSLPEPWRRFLVAMPSAGRANGQRSDANPDRNQLRFQLCRISCRRFRKPLYYPRILRQVRVPCAHFRQPVDIRCQRVVLFYMASTYVNRLAFHRSPQYRLLFCQTRHNKARISHQSVTPRPIFTV